METKKITFFSPGAAERILGYDLEKYIKLSGLYFDLVICPPYPVCNRLEVVLSDSSCCNQGYFKEG